MIEREPKLAVVETFDRCGFPIDQCRCPYCGETALCTCCIGYGVATGG